MTEKNTITEGKTVRDFKLTRLSLENRNTVILLTVLLAIFGFLAYKSMPRELFPEINIPFIFVKTIYPGNAPIDMENLITRPLEKEIHTVTGIKELRSKSTQDNSDIFIEFNTDVKISDALQDVKDAVDKAKSELPDDLDMDPLVMDFDFNEFPIINVNLSGDYSLNELKAYAEYLEDELESIPEISKVEIKGLDEREIQINVDPYKLESFQLSFSDIEDAVNFENISISGGDLVVDKTTRSIRTIGEFTDIKEIENIIVKRESADEIVYLRDVAEVKDGFEDPLTYARLDRQPVVSLQVVKKAGENLLIATDKLFAVLAEAKQSGAIPNELNITLSNDQSEFIRDMINNLENSIIMGFIFVVLVLLFFLGLRNALLVGISIPMSMLITFVVLSLMGYTLNMMFLFGLVLALGMLVDNAIVAVENVYRYVHQGHSLLNAARYAVSEIAVPIITSTATTLAAFSPLLFWKGILGEFMKQLPVTLIVALSSSLFVALVIIPVFTSRFMKRQSEQKPPAKKRSFIIMGILIAAAVFSYLVGMSALGTFLLFMAFLVLLNLYALYPMTEWSQQKFLPRLEEFYLKTLRFWLKGKRPVWLVLGTFGLLVLMTIFFVVRAPNIVLFPVNEPNFINVFAELPIGTDITATNDFMFRLEDKIYKIIDPYKPIVESVLTTVGKGVVGQNEFSTTNTPNKGMTTLTFVDYRYRHGIHTSEVLKLLSAELVGKYPGVKISMEKDIMGPPTGKAVNIEISGPDFVRLIDLTQSIQQYIEEADIKGIEGLSIDLDVGSPELLINIDREKVRRFGLSTAQVAGTLRTALFGKEISDFKEGEDEYNIRLRLGSEYRNSISVLINQKITFRSQSSGKIIQVPISAVAGFQPGTTYGSVNRLDMDKVITLWSNVVEGYNPSKINMEVKELMKKYSMPQGYHYKFTGEQQEQEEASSFLGRAMLIALALILLIMVTQFNSLSKPLIILTSVLFSTIGVFAGIATFRMDFVIIMSGIGIITLAGVVVNNAIVLIDYTDLLKSNTKKKLGIGLEDDLPIEEAVPCIIQAGRTRMRPVLLTAITTILGLVPMAMGLNINFNTLLSRFDPQVYFGGDNALFWGPLAWTVIFGLAFATFLTLVVVPAMYLVGNRVKLRIKERFKK
jgi:multidrug efflux pump subunit AcrB